MVVRDMTDSKLYLKRRTSIFIDEGGLKQEIYFASNLCK